MGITKSIEIAGKDLSIFHCRLCNPGIYDAPKRDVTKISIPGRNGDLTLDNGRFENVSVKYECLIESNDAVQDFEDLKSWIKSLIGYQRIEDGFHFGEYRMGCFDQEITVSAADRSSISFNLKADCKPQRYLVEGEREYGNVVPGELHSQWEGFYRLPEFTNDGTSTLYVRPVGDFADIPENAVQDDDNNLVTSAAVTAWNNGEFYDLTQVMTTMREEIYLSTSYSWEVKTNVLTGADAIYKVLADIPVENITPYESKPVFIIKSTNRISLATYFMQFIVNGIRIRVLQAFIDDHAGCDLYIDSEVQDCYYIDDGVKKNANAYVSLVDSAGNNITDFPIFAPGINHIVPVYESNLYYKPFSTLSYIPRWYTI